MKAKLEFDLDTQEDKDRFERYVNSDKVYCLLDDILSELRSDYKYGQAWEPISKLENHSDVAADIAEFIGEKMGDLGVDRDIVY